VLLVIFGKGNTVRGAVLASVGPDALISDKGAVPELAPVDSPDAPVPSREFVSATVKVGRAVPEPPNGGLVV
jgi:hypothetical protein